MRVVYCRSRGRGPLSAGAAPQPRVAVIVVRPGAAAARPVVVLVRRPPAGTGRDVRVLAPAGPAAWPGGPGGRDGHDFLRRAPGRERRHGEDALAAGASHFFPGVLFANIEGLPAGRAGGWRASWVPGRGCGAVNRAHGAWMDNMRGKRRASTSELLAARGRAAARTADGHAFHQRPAGHHEIAVVQVVAQPAIKRIAVRVNPEGDGGDFRVEGVHDLAEVGRR